MPIKFTILYNKVKNIGIEIVEAQLPSWVIGLFGCGRDHFATDFSDLRGMLIEWFCAAEE